MSVGYKYQGAILDSYIKPLNEQKFRFIDMFGPATEQQCH